jgi:hypothetical protein
MIDIKLKRTCTACPEQYDAMMNGDKVGYLRLRHGVFTVHFPDENGHQIYYSEKSDGHGEFTDEERDYFLSVAKDKIKQNI